MQAMGNLVTVQSTAELDVANRLLLHLEFGHPFWLVPMYCHVELLWPAKVCAWWRTDQEVGTFLIYLCPSHVSKILSIEIPANGEIE